MAQSTADRFIDVMARIRSLDDHTNNDEPMRHEIRGARRMATEVLEQAITQAWALADLGHSVKLSSDAAIKEAKALTEAIYVKG